MGQVEQELKDLLYINRISVKEAAARAGTTYSSMASYLKGFVRMKESVRACILKMIAEKQVANNGVVSGMAPKVMG